MPHGEYIDMAFLTAIGATVVALLVMIGIYAALTYITRGPSVDDSKEASE